VAVANSLTVVARRLSAARALLGDKRQAVAHAQQALAVAEKVRFRPEIAPTRLQLAEVEPDAALAVAHLESAVAEFRAMDMRPGFVRGLHLQWRAQAQQGRRAPPTRSRRYKVAR
jgi:hypothetical protein